MKKSICSKKDSCEDVQCAILEREKLHRYLYAAEFILRIKYPVFYVLLDQHTQLLTQ